MTDVPILNHRRPGPNPEPKLRGVTPYLRSDAKMRGRWRDRGEPLTWYEAQYLRTLWREGNATVPELAALYGVTAEEIDTALRSTVDK